MTPQASYAARKTGAITEGEFLLTASDFSAIAAMLRADAGIAIPESKATLVYSRLAKRLRALGLSSFAEYCDLVGSPAGAEERGQMLAALTTNVTRFFREPHHFDHLRTEVLPPLLRAAERGNPVRLWSAACSTGPEPYSAALTILDLLPGAAALDVRILATDIDPNVLATGQAGVYDEASMAGVPVGARRWFQRVDAGWAAGEDLRRLVAFRPLNLIGDWPMRGRFEAVFCRNVVIYFDEATQASVWRRFVPMIAPGGILYIGHSERVSGPAAARFDNVGITTYRLKADGA